MAEDSDNFFGPPVEPVEVFCLHCGNVYSSSDMKFIPAGDGACVRNGVHGDWVCPAPGCDGIGYRFDIHSIEEWESQSSDDEYCDEEFGDNEFSEAYIEEIDPDKIDDPVSASEDEGFLPASPEDPEEAFREIQRDMTWWDTHDYPFVRLWRMWVHFRPHTLPEPIDDSRRALNEDDIPF